MKGIDLLNDWMVYGMYIEKYGKRIDPEDFYKIEEELMQDQNIDRRARELHDLYERAAAKIGWLTQEACRSKSYEEIPSANRSVMREIARHVEQEIIRGRIDELEQLVEGDISQRIACLRKHLDNLEGE